MEHYSLSLDQAFHALSDPTRRAVVARLCDRREASVTELAAPFEMGLPAFLKHLRVLEESGLVATEKVGRVRSCRLQAEALGEVEDWLAARRRQVKAQLDRFAAYAEALDAKRGDPE
ncbi:metalloregulator ArsR/SmtB family transcription factor [Albimonas sp. CAU 1670]|uniref:ArsR/SmtB family transcription factor n=1 Tax=Albimonas sp. CAU 1670 TaxID=3032599 RepID=UPI0023D9B786|nr:metalloregulator ArsR/SmtB family transcription factor [Albimonas sp. CAU 1670]MDF2233526.1 metalloregulator ArsR/SmtB family transcription factor [Albimonas sp. CAU 1670]